MATKLRPLVFVCCYCLTPVPGEYWCYGCRSTICEKCDEELCVGAHAVTEHRRDLKPPPHE